MCVNRTRAVVGTTILPRRLRVAATAIVLATAIVAATAFFNPALFQQHQRRHLAEIKRNFEDPPPPTSLRRPRTADDCSQPLRNPCCSAMRRRAPDVFSVSFETNYGGFSASCVRTRAPVWVDRVYNLINLKYYDANYFARVLRTPTLSVAQFGTSGDPSVSNVYNYSTTSHPRCAILQPQPTQMPACSSHRPCAHGLGLSNLAGTGNAAGIHTTLTFRAGPERPAFVSRVRQSPCPRGRTRRRG